MGLTSVLPLRVEAQVARLLIPVLLDSGSVRSLISFRHYQQLNLGDTELNLVSTEVNCVSASGQNLEIVGQVQVILKIGRFPWPWIFLVSKRLQGQPILGADFIAKTSLVLDLGQSKAYFRFAPQEYVNFLGSKGGSQYSCTTSLSSRFAHVQCGKLSKRQRGQLEQLNCKYPDVLTEKLGRTHTLEYDIQVLDPTPVRSAPYRLAPPKMQYLHQHIQQLLKDGIIEPSTSHYSSPMFLVPKAGGAYRAVVDFRALNKRIAIESVPLPDVHSAFHWFAKAKIFTTLDLNSAYYQVPLSEASKPLTAFCTDWNLYQYRSVPFGLATGAQVLTRLLDRVFQDLKFEFVYHYLDDVVVYSESFEEHLTHLEAVLERLRAAGLTVKPDKVVFGTSKFLS